MIIRVPKKRAKRGISNKQFGCWRTGHRDHRPTMICKAIHSPLQRGGVGGGAVFA